MTSEIRVAQLFGRKRRSRGKAKESRIASRKSSDSVAKRDGLQKQRVELSIFRVSGLKE